MGTGLVYMTASALFRMSSKPWVVGGLAMWWGYVRSLLSRRRRYPDPEFRRFLRRYQWACLFRGKRKATMALDRQGEAKWKSRGHPEWSPRAIAHSDPA